MKNKLFILTLGCMLIISGCGNKRVVEEVAPVSDVAEKESTVEETENNVAEKESTVISDSPLPAEIPWDEDALFCYVDVDNDGEEELCVKGRTDFFVYEKDGDTYKAVYEGRNYDVPIATEDFHGIFYYKQGAAPYNETYIVTEMSASGEASEVLYASWYDADENDSMDETDDFFLDDMNEVNVSKDEWLKAVEKYEALKEVNVEWEE